MPSTTGFATGGGERQGLAEGAAGIANYFKTSRSGVTVLMTSLWSLACESCFRQPFPASSAVEIDFKSWPLLDPLDLKIRSPVPFLPFTVVGRYIIKTLRASSHTAVTILPTPPTTPHNPTKTTTANMSSRSGSESKPKRAPKKPAPVQTYESEGEESAEEALPPPARRPRRQQRQQRQQQQGGGELLGGAGLNGVTDTAGGLVGGVTGALGGVAGNAVQNQGGGDKGKSDTLRLRLDLNLDIEITLKAKIHGDLELALLYVYLSCFLVFLLQPPVFPFYVIPPVSPCCLAVGFLTSGCPPLIYCRHGFIFSCSASSSDFFSNVVFLTTLAKRSM